MATNKNKHLTLEDRAIIQKGINQADISKIENGTRNPSIRLLQRLADGMDMVLNISFTPKKDTNQSI